MSIARRLCELVFPRTDRSKNQHTVVPTVTSDKPLETPPVKKEVKILPGTKWCIVRDDQFTVDEEGYAFADILWYNPEIPNIESRLSRLRCARINGKYHIVNWSNYKNYYERVLDEDFFRKNPLFRDNLLIIGIKATEQRGQLRWMDGLKHDLQLLHAVGHTGFLNKFVQEVDEFLVERMKVSNKKQEEMRLKKEKNRKEMLAILKQFSDTLVLKVIMSKMIYEETGELKLLPAIHARQLAFVFGFCELLNFSEAEVTQLLGIPKAEFLTFFHPSTFIWLEKES